MRIPRTPPDHETLAREMAAGEPGRIVRFMDHATSRSNAAHYALASSVDEHAGG